jgi:chromate transporter
MEQDLVQDRHWVTKEEFREGVAVCQSLPGPLAIQVGIFLSYILGGFWGAWAGGWAFVFPNFVIVATLGALFVQFGDLPLMRAIFYGVSPAVIALIVYSCYRLTKLGMDDVLQWFIAAVCFAVTVVARAEIAFLFVGSGIAGILYYAVLRDRKSALLPLLAAIPPLVSGQDSAGILARLFAFFLKAGSLTFGSGLVIVPFLEKGLVQQTGWLTERQFLVAVAIGMLSPGPVVITATFVGYLVAGFWGSLASTLGIFLPSFLLILIVAPILVRHRANRYIQGFVKGAFAAAIGAIFGAAVLLSRIAIGDWLTIVIALGSLGALARWNVRTYLLVAVTAVIGLVAFPLLNPSWIFMK